MSQDDRYSGPAGPKPDDAGVEWLEDSEQVPRRNPVSRSQPYYPGARPVQGQGYYAAPQGQGSYAAPQGQAARPAQERGSYAAPQGQAARPAQERGSYAAPQGQAARPAQGQGSYVAPQERDVNPSQDRRIPQEQAQRPAAQQESARPQRQEVEDRIFQAQQAQIRRARQESMTDWGAEPPEPPELNEPLSGRGRRMSVPIILLIVLLVAGMGVAVWQLLSILNTYRRDRSAYEDLAGQAIQVLAEKSTPTPAPEKEEEEEEENFVSEIPISVDWDYLRTINGDIVGWLYCPDTVINYPVVQTSNNSYYLKHGFDGQSNSAGTLFADMSSTSGVTLSNLIIYGHNMKDGSMFHSLMGYVNENYFWDYPTMYYLTPDANYRVDLICAHIVESTLNNFPTYFSTEASYQTYINTITSRSFWVNYDALTTDYQLITFSTCSYTSGYADPRMLVHGLMVPVR